MVGQMAAARGAEERTARRQPVDLIALCQRAGIELPHLFTVSDHAIGRITSRWPIGCSATIPPK